MRTSDPSKNEESRLERTSDGRATTVFGQQVTHRQFLKMLGGAAGLAALGQVAVTPEKVQAAHLPGAAPDGGDLINTHLTVEGNLTVKGPLPWTDVRAYGATGSGDATNIDDTAAIQTAINAAQAAGGGVVYFPWGTYLLSSTLMIPANVSLSGPNNGQARLKRMANHNAPLVTVSGDRVVIANLVFDGNDANQSTNGYPEINVAGSYVRIEHCEFTSWVSLLVRVDAASVRKYITIRGNHATGRADAPGSGYWSTTNAGGFWMENAEYFEITDNVLDAAPTAVSDGAGGGIVTLRGGPGTIRGNTLRLYNRTLDGIVSWGAHDLVIEGNVVDSANDDCITYRDYIDGTVSERITIQGNVLLNAGTSGVYCPADNQHKHIVIAGNVIKNTGLAGITFGNAIYSAVVGNTIDTAGTHGIIVSSALGSPVTDSVVADNVIYGSKHHGMLVLPGCVRNTISGNRIRNSGSFGVYLGAADNSITDNMVDGSSSGGIYLDNAAKRCTITDNHVFDNPQTGIRCMTGSDDAHLVGNHVSNNHGDGINIYSHRFTVSGCRVSRNRAAGIQVFNANNGMITGNVVMNNHQDVGTIFPYGIRIHNVSRTVVTGDKIGDDQAAATQTYQLLEGGTSNHNTIVGNDLTPGPNPLVTTGANTKVAHNMGVAADSA